MSKLGLTVVSVVMVVLLACSAPEPTPTSTPVPTPTPIPSPTPKPVVVCVPEVVDYVTAMAEEVETVIESGEELDTLLQDPSDDLVWRAKVAKEVLDMSGALTTIATTTPPEPFPTVYEEINNVATDFERILQSAELVTDTTDIKLEEAIEMLGQAIENAIKSHDLIVEWLSGCRN